jgi:SAM-dependent methyltransferase
MLEGRFGHFLVQVGSGGIWGAPFVSSRIRSQLVVTPTLPASRRQDWIQGLPEQLPIAGDSVDQLLLLHTLDFCADPHLVLREAERVLIPEGRLLITGFNPWSLWGLWRLFLRRSGQAPWQGRFLPPFRVRDWLSLLGFECEKSEMLMFRPPLVKGGLMRRLQLLESLGARWWPALGAVYVLMAVKRVSTLTPERPAWKLAPGILRGRAIEPTARIKPGRT